MPGKLLEESQQDEPTDSLLHECVRCGKSCNEAVHDKLCQLCLQYLERTGSLRLGGDDVDNNFYGLFYGEKYGGLAENYLAPRRCGPALSGWTIKTLINLHNPKPVDRTLPKYTYDSAELKVSYPLPPVKIETTKRVVRGIVQDFQEMESKSETEEPCSPVKIFVKKNASTVKSYQRKNKPPEMEVTDPSKSSPFKGFDQSGECISINDSESEEELVGNNFLSSILPNNKSVPVHLLNDVEVDLSRGSPILESLTQLEKTMKAQIMEQHNTTCSPRKLLLEYSSLPYCSSPEWEQSQKLSQPNERYAIIVLFI